MATHPKRAKRQTELSPEQLQRADVLIRQMVEKQQVLFLRLVALDAKVETLSASITQANLLWVKILQDPEARKDAENAEQVKQDTRIQHYKQ